MTEYVRFSPQESIYGEKSILHSELLLLRIVKIVRNYKRLRKEDLVLRFALKKKIEEILEGLKLLDKVLPHDKLPELNKKKPKSGKEEEKEDMEGLSLEQELEVIRRKLERLG